MMELIGILGSVIVLIVFFLSQTGKISTQNVWYDFGNFLGSFLLLIYAIAGNSIPFIIVNFAWAVISLWDVLKYVKANFMK